MFKSYFIVAWRNLERHKAYSFINIFGLAVGIASSLLIFLVIHYELSYDSFQSKKDRIYRVVTTYSNYSNGEITGHQSAVPIALPAALQAAFPQLEKISPVWYIGGAQVHIPIPGKDLRDEKKVKVDDGIAFAEPSLLTMFDYTWLGGSASRLTESNTVVVNKSLATEFFGNWKNAIGKTIQLWSYRVPLQIIGVFQDLPPNSDLEVTMVGSYATFRNMNQRWFAENDWETLPWNSECFLLLPEGSNAQQFQLPLAGFVKKHFPDHSMGHSIVISLSFQPLADMHLDENFYTYKSDALTHKELWSLGLIGFFLLLVACVNFINLATAQSFTRAKEIGVRKMLGSNRSQIFKQFINETAFITLVSLLLGCLLVYQALPFVSKLLKKSLTLNFIQSPSILLFLVLLGITVNFLAGFYPGIILSGFHPVKAFKNKISTSNIGGISIRRGLVVFQFVIAQFLIIGTIVVLQQMQFFRNYSLGFDKNAVAMVELPSNSTDRERYDYLKTQMLAIPGVLATSLCKHAPTSDDLNTNTFYFNNESVKKDFNTDILSADTGFINTFHISKVAGRIPYPSDTMREVMVNETMVRKLGLTSVKDMLGKTISFDNNTHLPVVGIVRDFHSRPLKEAIRPLIIYSQKDDYNFIALRLEPSAMQTTLPKIHKVFAATYPTYIYDLQFVDEELTQFYTTETLASQLFNIAACLSIFISCLGLYGLVSFMAAQKTKEVGIRKVLGASVQSIVYLFSKEFTLLIGLAFLIAAPLGYFLMQRWLNDFYYHIEISWLAFALAILISLIIAWLTVGYKAIRTAIANPVKSLRTE